MTPDLPTLLLVRLGLEVLIALAFPYVLPLFY